MNNNDTSVNGGNNGLQNTNVMGAGDTPSETPVVPAESNVQSIPSEGASAPETVTEPVNNVPNSAPQTDSLNTGVNEPSQVVPTIEPQPVTPQTNSDMSTENPFLANNTVVNQTPVTNLASNEQPATPVHIGVQNTADTPMNTAPMMNGPVMNNANQTVNTMAQGPELSATTLTEPVAPVVPSQTPVINETPTMGSDLGVNQVNLANSFNEFNNANPNNNIIQSVPTPPVMNTPVDNEKKKDKKGMSKTTIFVLAILLVCVIGAGIYLLLNFVGNKKSSGTISVKDLTLEMGKPLSTTISDYATIEGFDISTCKVDATNVNIEAMGSYTFKVTCGSTSKNGTIIIQDRTAPVVTVKKVVVAPGTAVTLENFIESCTDFSNCSYELEDSSINLETLTATEGLTEFNIVVSDDYDNKVTKEVTLQVTTRVPVKNMYCTQTGESTLNATLETSYRYGIDEVDALVTMEKVAVYTFATGSGYDAAKTDYETNGKIEEMEGTATFDDTEHVITIVSDITDLNAEFSGETVPTNYSELKQYHLDKGFTCKNR